MPNPTQATPTKEWTIMVYLAGDNNLSSAGEVDLNEMKQVGSTDDMNIVVQFDREGPGAQTTRYLVQKDTPLERDAVMTLGETNMGDPAVLESFATWAVRAYPAKRYMLVLWNHGSGWDDEDIYHLARSMGAQVLRRGVPVVEAATGAGDARSAPITTSVTRRIATSRFRRALFASTVSTALKKRAIAFDDQAQDFLDNMEMKRVLKTIAQAVGRKLDILGMDACLMSMVEVAHQVRDSASFMVGSEELEPEDGWPYHTILSKLAAKPKMTTTALCKLIVQAYLGSYGPPNAVTQSAFDLAQTAPLVQAVNKLGQLLKTGLKNTATREAIVQARTDAQEYRQPEFDYVDLLDLCALIKTRVKSKSIVQACTAVAEAAKPFVIATGRKGAQVKHSQGASIYFPTREVSALYATLDFTRQNGWDEFLYAYVMRRGRRS